ncbi:MAG: cbb3-type cytochrome oxidase assembly protein CcoS [Pirellulaceae bacterium]|jgi:cbb3-type cytochrome oxidase maturation protein
MSVIYVALPIALGLSLAAVIAFALSVRSGQFDDLETPQRRMLHDDIPKRK